MSLRQAIVLGIAAFLPVAAGCGSYHDSGLYYYEEAYLDEDVFDLMTNVLATGESAYLGDVVDPLDITQLPDATNRQTVVYTLPDAYRLGFGPGSGEVALQITEDGVDNPDPLAFSWATTAALTVDLVYEIYYLGLTPGNRESDVLLQAHLVATRASTLDPFDFEYVISGTCYFGTTYCDFSTRFRAPGPPSAGPEAGYGDGDGYIDDPDVYDVFDIDIDWGTDRFRASGPVGCCADYDADYFYDEFFF